MRGRMGKKILGVLAGIFVLLSACGRGSEENAVGITETAREYETISYKEFQERTGKKAEFYHGTRFIGEIPDSPLSVIFEGEYDEDEAGAVLADGHMPIRLQGPLGGLLHGIGEEMSLTEFAGALSAGGAAEAVFKRLEGAGTAYYIAEDFVQIQFDSDQNGEYDRLLLISMDEAAAENVGSESLAWLEMLPDQ